MSGIVINRHCYVRMSCLGGVRLNDLIAYRLFYMLFESVFLNKFVIFLICGPVNVKMAHFFGWVGVM
jgi:hypothetical protein